MALPKPVPGLVIRYGYLWFREYMEGHEEGRKDRPCAIIAAIRSDEAGSTEVLVLPITHAPPEKADAAVELPTAIKSRLGLDDTPSWVVLSEWNAFVWPGADLRRVPGSEDGFFAYGILPPKFFAMIRDRFLDVVRNRRGEPVIRTRGRRRRGSGALS